MRTSVAAILFAPARSKQGLTRGGAKRQRGQALVFSLFAAMLIILSLFAMYSMNSQAIEKIKLQNTADAAAYSAVVAEARDYNFSAYTNRAMVANQVAVAQFVGMTSWFRNMAAHGKGDNTNAGRVVYGIFFKAPPSPLGNIYQNFLKGMGNIFGIFEENRPGTTFMSAAVTVLDGLIRVYSESQRIYHYGTALTVVQTLGAFSTIGDAMADLTGINWFSSLSALDGNDNDRIIQVNDPEAQLTSTGGVAHLVYHLYKWYTFTERKDPNTEAKDGPLADRFAQVTLDSLDDFSRDRSTKPAWGFSFFYAPPLTFIDPTRFIPYQSGPLFIPVIHRGGTELKVTNGSGGTISPDTDGSTGVNCHGQTVTSSASGTGNISVDYHNQLPMDKTVICEGDSGMVNVGNGTHPKGVYAFDGTSWIDPQKMTGGTRTPASKGSGNAGTANNRMKKTWTAMDASSWAGLNLIWISILGIPIPLPIPFAPPWMPLSHGAAQSGKQLGAPTVLATDNNFGVKPNEAYGGTVSSWTTAISAGMRQNKGAGKSLDMVSSLGGLTPYMDVKNVTAANNVGPALVVEIEKPTSKMPKSPGVGRFALENGAAEDVMRALSKAEVYFARPTNDTALTWFKRVSDNPSQVELGSLYNPYWQPRLAANNFLEQYLSMEMQRSGL